MAGQTAYDLLLMMLGAVAGVVFIMGLKFGNR